MSVEVPELLAPAGSLDAVRAALANGADAVYLGVGRFNARDDGAQLTLGELDEACRLARSRSCRVYLTLNTLVKPHEMLEALELLGDAVDLGISAVIVQDVGLIRLIRLMFPTLEVHGSTQMTIHDASGARMARDLGVARVVLARENTLDDIRAISAAVPGVGLEAFVHGALCISYSGQCYMSGMISDRSANRGSCAQSCRKEYVLAAASGEELDRGYLISARDLGAHEHIAEMASAGVQCLKVEGRKKRPEYVATVTQAYRAALNRLARGDATALQATELQPLVQIYSRGFTSGMLGGRVGRSYVTRDQPDNRGVVIGVVRRGGAGEIEIEVDDPVRVGDGLGFEDPAALGGPTIGFTVARVRGVRQLANQGAPGCGQIIAAPHSVPTGWRVVRTARPGLVDGARQSYASVTAAAGGRVRLDVRVFGSAGAPLKAVFSVDGHSSTVRSETQLAPATRRPLDAGVLREQFGRLGETPFVLGVVDVSGLSGDLFLPIRELNHMRSEAVRELGDRTRIEGDANRAARRDRLVRALADVGSVPTREHSSPFTLVAEVFSVEQARLAADAGATEVCLDPFLRHPAPPVARVRSLASDLHAKGIVLRVRTPTIVRAPERAAVDKWLALDLPVLSGHVGILAELGRHGRDVVADYAVNCFNQHTAAELLRLGARRVTLSVELTVNEMLDVAAPFPTRPFEIFLFGRPEGMTIEHCVLSAAFDRVPTTCRDLCVRDHPNVELTDPTGYVFPVATDSACRNRLLHSRRVDGSEYLGRLWQGGCRAYRAVFNVPGDDVATVTTRLRRRLETLAAGDATVDDGRLSPETAFTRGHFARAV